MTCASCVRHVERALSKVDGVSSATVNLATERATVHASQPIDEAVLVKAVEDAGYEARPLASPNDRSKAEAPAKTDLIVAVAFSVPLLLVTMLPMMLPRLHAVAPSFFHFFMGWGGLLLAAPVQLWAGRRFVKSGIAELRHASPGMSTLVMLGSGSALLFSIAVLLAPGIFPRGTAHTYFEASASIVTLIL